MEAEKLSVKELFGRLKVGQAWTVVVTLFGLLAGAFTLGYVVSCTLNEGQLASKDAIIASKDTEITAITAEVKRLKEAVAIQQHQAPEQRTDDLSDCPVLVAGRAQFDQRRGLTERIRRVWKVRVDEEPAASPDTFFNALKRGYPIVHLSAGFGNTRVWFADDVISMERFRSMIAAPRSTRLLILDGCSSFLIGEALKDAKLDYLVVHAILSEDMKLIGVDMDATSEEAKTAVAERNAAADVFFDSFYQRLAKGLDAPESFEGAIDDVKARHKEADKYFRFKSYKKP